jgi:hypothetical protein
VDYPTAAFAIPADTLSLNTPTVLRNRSQGGPRALEALTRYQWRYQPFTPGLAASAPWTPFSTLEQPQPLSFPDTGWYRLALEVENAGGCLDSTQQQVYVRRYYLLRIPNVFTPNGDGLHDRWRPFGENFRIQQMEVYDRWGVLIWQGGREGWDGRNQEGEPTPPGTYFYQVFGNPLNKNEVLRYNGATTLIRK